MTAQDGLSSSFVETVAGFTAGIVSTLCLHPLDLIKTRLQVDRTSPSRLGSSLRIIRHILQHEGGPSAFYRGLSPNLLGNSTSWALYFLSYNHLKSGLRRLHHAEPDTPLSAAEYFAASGGAGLLTSLATNPIWVLKTRMLSTGAGAPGAYASLATGVARIYAADGLRGFYRGLLPSLFGVSHGALQFMAYERLKVRRVEMRGGGGAALGNADYFVISSLAKVFAGAVTYPYQVLRARLQTYDAHLVYRGVGDAVRQIWVMEGVAGFYKGLGTNLFRVLPSTWVTFLVYENTRVYLPRLISQDGEKE